MNIFIVFLFSMTVLRAVLIFLVVYGFAGDFYKDSELSLSQLKEQAGIRFNGKIAVRERIHREKFLRSCQVQKVKFGLSNFIEKTTPPIFQLFCLDRIADLLLIR